MFLSPLQKNTQQALSWRKIKKQLTASGTSLLVSGACQLGMSSCLAFILVVGTASAARAAETAAGGTTNAAAMNYFKEGCGKLEGGDNSAALIAFTQAITLDPKFYKAYANRCASRINLHDYKGAIEDINVALKCFPNEPKVLALKTQAEQLMQNQASGNNNNNDQQAMAEERAAAARRALAQAMIGGDFADPSTMIMMQAQRNGLMNGNAGAARPVVNPFAPKVAPEGSSGKDNPFTVHNQPGISSASSTDNSPFAQSSNSAEQSIHSGVSSSSGSDNPFDEKKTNSESAAAPKANGAADNLPLTARLKIATGTAKAGSGRGAAKQYYDLGCAKAESRKFASAIEEFGQAISHDSSFGEAYANRGLSRFHNHDYQGALTDFQRADQLSSNNAQIKSFIQSAKRALGN
jgi:tetratricopeptide (TPR) repeat protein